MKLGYLTSFSKKEAQLAASIGFDALEAHARSWELEKVKGKSKLKDLADRTKLILDEHSLVLTAIANYDRNALTDPLRSVVTRFRKVIEFSSAMGVGVVSALSGRLPDQSAQETIDRFKKVFGEIARIASDNGVKIAFENWPGMGGYPLRSCNIAYCPAFWDMMFDAVPSKALGLEFDPSHLYWLGIDYIKAARDYAPRIYHAHAKDTEILDEQRQSFGIYEGRWWRYRIPGFGEIDWPAFISKLFECGYNGGMAIEHEDSVFSGKNFAEGLRLGYNFLAPLMPR